MTFVPQSRILPRSLWRPAILFFAIAQVLLAFSPILEGNQGKSSRAHVEEAGTTLHHAHNEADCAACAARGLLSSADPARPELPLSIGPRAHLIPRSADPSQFAWIGDTRSRAPPAALA